MNPMQLIAMLRGGGNPQQLVMSLLQGEMGNTPMGQNLLSLAQKGGAPQIEEIARNICKQKGVDFDKEFSVFKQLLGIR